MCWTRVLRPVAGLDRRRERFLSVRPLRTRATRTCLSLDLDLHVEYGSFISRRSGGQRHETARTNSATDVADSDRRLLRRAWRHRIRNPIVDGRNRSQICKHGSQIGIREVLDRFPRHRRQDGASPPLVTTAAHCIHEVLLRPGAESRLFVRRQVGRVTDAPRS